MSNAQTAARTLYLLPSIPAAAGLGAAMGGAGLAAQAGLWCAAAVANLALVAHLVGRVAAAAANNRPISPLGLAAKLPLTLAAVWIGLRHSDVRAMIVGVAAAVGALLLTSLATNRLPIDGPTRVGPRETVR